MHGKLDIARVAQILKVNPVTLRRWEKQNLIQSHRDHPTAHRYYYEDDIEDFLSSHYKYLLKLAQRWSFEKIAMNIPLRFYCRDAAVFKSRLSKLEILLQKNTSLTEKFSLVTAVVGEIGNNSFDHNLGNWPDLPGLFFGYSLQERKIILADRGQGVLTTLKRVKKDLSTHKEALYVAFTEVISGRAPESRGNGLKYVRSVVQEYKMKLSCNSGDAICFIDDDFSVLKSEKNMRGCYTIFQY